MASCYCEKCKKTMADKEFYSSHNLEKYPTGRLTQCKKCITMHVDNWDPNTYLWILQECDVPYIANKWNETLATWGKDPTKVTGTTILGRYLSKMKLKPYTDYRWKDNEFLQEIENKKIEEAMKRQGFGAAEIAEAIAKGGVVPQVAPPPPPIEEEGNAPAPVDFVAESFVEEQLDLTDEDKTYLRLKWGKTYRPDEWVALEQLYNEFCESYEIKTAGHIDTLKLICKTSLKANQLIDMGDVEAYQKMSKVYDSLMKSGRFTAAQIKAEQGQYVDSICELVEMCEKQGFIPRYYTDGPQDKVDKIILDMQKYTHDLVTEEMGLGNLIENAVKQLLDEKEAIKAASEAPDMDEDDALFNFDPIEVTDEDFKEFNELQNELEEADFLTQLEEEDDE